jgi:hypothetical protein
MAALADYNDHLSRSMGYVKEDGGYTIILVAIT